MKCLTSLGLACLMNHVPMAWAENIPEVLQADYVMKKDSQQALGLVASYIDRPQWAEITQMGASPQPQSHYASFGFGPSVDINQHVRAYGVVGAATTLDSNQTDSAPLQALTLDSEARMYGVGVSIRPNEQWSLNMQYQNAQLQLHNQEAKQVNYFNFGVAYRY